MSSGYQIYDQQGLYFLTFQVVDWVDVFTRPAYKKVITDSFSFCRKNKGLELFAYVVMSNHVHLIARAKEGYILSDIIRDFKKFTANNLLLLIAQPEESRNTWMLKRFEINAAQHQRNSHFQVWTHENHAEEIHTSHFFEQKMRYIHENPVRAAIVEEPQHYYYSSARNFAGLSTPVEIDFYF